MRGVKSGAEMETTSRAVLDRFFGSDSEERFGGATRKTFQIDVIANEDGRRGEYCARTPRQACRTNFRRSRTVFVGASWRVTCRTAVKMYSTLLLPEKS